MRKVGGQYVRGRLLLAVLAAALAIVIVVVTAAPARAAGGAACARNGDYNRDGRVDVVDYTVWAADFLTGNAGLACFEYWRRAGFLAVVPTATTPPPPLTAPPSPPPKRQPGRVINKKLYILVFNPRLANGQKLTVYKNWVDPRQATDEHIQFFKKASGGRVNYAIADFVEEEHFPRKADGFVYNEQSYLAVVGGGAPPHQPDTVDWYGEILDPGHGICAKLNQGEIDELWVFGGPWFGFWESSLAGPRGFPYNGDTYTEAGCNKLMPMMGFNYERITTGHHFGHRAEATLAHVYGGWEENRMAHNWDKFGLVAAQSPDYSFSGCGSIHYPPNGRHDYDYANQTPVLSFCADFTNYPDLSAPESVLRPISCSAWGCSEVGYISWWFQHLPGFAGVGPDGKLNDWWEYFVDPNKALEANPDKFNYSFPAGVFSEHERGA